ncbi:Hypothetical predicted protein [Podarcis lilfordi]|uniref:Uncharacterized protein n=1 Tax=Podarcis lilfordi TaxID=74358 RepID=A0AA35PLJ0_9SAUR|nr:Hypothetical predicted protein [Podarcis lilfordi]
MTCAKPRNQPDFPWGSSGPQQATRSFCTFDMPFRSHSFLYVSANQPVAWRHPRDDLVPSASCLFSMLPPQLHWPACPIPLPTCCAKPPIVFKPLSELGQAHPPIPLNRSLLHASRTHLSWPPQRLAFLGWIRPMDLRGIRWGRRRRRPRAGWAQRGATGRVGQGGGNIAAGQRSVNAVCPGR